VSPCRAVVVVVVVVPPVVAGRGTPPARARGLTEVAVGAHLVGGGGGGCAHVRGQRVAPPATRGLHSSTSELKLSRSDTKYTLDTP